MEVKGKKSCIPLKLMVCLSHGMKYRQQSEGISMAETGFPGSEAASTEQISIIEDCDAEGHMDLVELDEELEEELIIEDFTIDGICGVY